MPGEPIQLGLIGFGYWGRKLFAELQVDKRFVVRTIVTRGRATIGEDPPAPWTDDLGRIASDRRIDGVVVATPAPTHHEIGRRMLAAGKHLFIEKPLAMTGAQARELRQIARANGCRVLVDYTFSMLPGVERVRQIAAAGEIGLVEGVHLTMTQLGRFNDLDVYQLLASHMLAVLNVFCPLDNLDPVRHDLVGRNGAVETGAILFAAGWSARPWVSDRLRGIIDVSLNHVKKIRRVVLYGTGGSLCYDMTEGSPIRVVRYNVHRERSTEPVGMLAITDTEFTTEPGLRSVLSAYYDLLRGGRPDNLDPAVAVNEALDRLQVGESRP